MSTEVTGLTEVGGRVIGVTATTVDGPIEDSRATWSWAATVASRWSGLPRHSRSRIWARPSMCCGSALSKKPGDPKDVLGRLSLDKMIVTIDRGDYWQCAYVIAKDGSEQVHAAGIEAFRQAVADGARFLADRIGELQSFDDVKLLSVAIDRLTNWSKPGLLCIGDAAHAMSPVGGVGINLAIQDAVATANLLASKLRAGTVAERDLDGCAQAPIVPGQSHTARPGSGPKSGVEAHRLG